MEQKDKKIIIFSGAGLSASSGISTFRDSGGLWDNYNIEHICQAGCLDWNYDETLHFYNLRRQDIKDKIPNNAHKIIAELKQKYPNNIEVITQNVDNLLERAGCEDILHLHGFLPLVRCMECGAKENIGYEKQENEKKVCQRCGAKMRPDIVFFGEAAPMYEKMYAKLQDCNMLVIIGTSGYVIDVSFLTQYADISILNNLEPSEAIVEEVFDKIYYEDAVSGIEKIKKDIEKFLNE